jgi:uncharacterized protein (TIGR03437 family)
VEVLDDRRLPSATPFSFSTGAPDGVVGTASHPPGPGGSAAPEFETADAFVLSRETQISQATFLGLVPAGTDLATDIQNVTVKIYRVFPKDSDAARSPEGLPGDPPSDVAFQEQDEASGGLTVTATVLDPNFAVGQSFFSDDALRGTKFGDGAQTGAEVQFRVAFTTPLDLPPDQYFFVPQVQLPGTAAFPFLWLSAPSPLNPPGSLPPAPPPQSWVRDNPTAAPDWLSVGSVYGRFLLRPEAIYLNASFALAGSSFAPTVSSLSRTSAPEGSAAIMLTLTGSDFTPGSAVLFNGVSLATTFVNAGQLTALVPANLLADEGTGGVVVFDAQRGLSNQQTFTITESPPTLDAGVLRPRDPFLVSVSGVVRDRAAETHRVVIAWGDGASDTLDLGHGTATAFARGHRYSRRKWGRRVTIRVTAIDDDGTPSGTQSFTIRAGR